jgi:catechol 2,3-dioxygenase-like lactoylglutathione lyase family enzyme
LTIFNASKILKALMVVDDIREGQMSRVQLALNVTDLDAAIGFYSKLFGTAPAKVRPRYANFAVADPPLKLVLIEGHGDGGTLNHLGVEVGSTDEVGAAQRRLTGEGLATAVEDQVTCCYAVQDKVWVDGPDREPWEIYTVLADAEMPAGQLRSAETSTGGPGACCDETSSVQAASCCDAPARA